MLIHADEVGAQGGTARVETFTVEGSEERGAVAVGDRRREYKTSFLEEGEGRRSCWLVRHVS